MRRLDYNNNTLKHDKTIIIIIIIISLYSKAETVKRAPVFKIIIKLFSINAHVLSTHPTNHTKKLPIVHQLHPPTPPTNHPTPVPLLTSNPPITQFTSHKVPTTAPYQRFTILSVTSRSLSALQHQRPCHLLTSHSPTLAHKHLITSTNNNHKALGTHLAPDHQDCKTYSLHYHKMIRRYHTF